MTLTSFFMNILLLTAIVSISPQQTMAETPTKPIAARPKSTTTKQNPSTTRPKPTTTRPKPTTTRSKPAITRSKPAITRPKPTTTKQNPSTTKKKPAITRPKSATAKKKTAMRQKKNKKAAPKHWFRASYLLDWGLGLAFAGGGLVLSFVEPFQRPFRLNDPTISFKFEKSTISTPLVAGLAVGVPLLLFGVSQFWVQSGHDFHHAALGLMETLGTTFFVTSLLKNAVGRQRPDFLERCQPNAKLECQGEKDLINEGRRSFPSGHSSIAFAGGMYMMFYLWGKLKPFDGQGAFWKIPLVFAPVAGATLVALTRLSDNRHHWEDVLVGALIGTTFAAIGYHLNFPAPWAKDSESPLTRHRISFAPIATPKQVGLAMRGSF